MQHISMTMDILIPAQRYMGHRWFLTFHFFLEFNENVLNIYYEKDIDLGIWKALDWDTMISIKGSSLRSVYVTDSYLTAWPQHII